MKKYKAYATVSYDVVCEFEYDENDPENENAWMYAKEIDGGDFSEIDGTGDFRVYEVIQVEEKL